MHVVCITDRSISDNMLFVLLTWNNLNKLALNFFLEDTVVSVLCPSLSVRKKHRNDTPVTLKVYVKWLDKD